MNRFPRTMVTFAVAVTLLFATGCSSMVRSGARQSRRQAVAFEKWKGYNAEDKTFSAALPSDPKVTSKQQTTTKTSSYRAKTAGESYSISVSTALSDEVAFRRDADQGAAKRKADILSKDQKEVKLAGEPAIECKWDVGAVHNRAIVLKTHQGTHLYCLTATWKTSTEPSNVQKFFDSFKPGAYTPKPAPTVTPKAEETPEAPVDEETETEPTGSPSPDEAEE